MYVSATHVDVKLKPLSLHHSGFQLLCGRDKHTAALGHISKG